MFSSQHPSPPKWVEVQYGWPHGQAKLVTHDGKGWMLDVKLVVVAIFFFVVVVHNSTSHPLYKTINYQGKEEMKVNLES
jgi:hypothetical protein